MYKIFIAMFLGVIASGAARADLYDVLRDVYQTNPTIAAQRTAVGAADAELDLARSGYKPYLGISAGVGLAHTELLGADYDYVPTQFGAQLQQNVFQGGAIMAKIKAARGTLRSQQAVLYSTQQDVFLDAINAYINILNADQVLELNENNLRVLDQYYDMVDARRSVGQLTQTDVDQAAARVQGAKYAVTQATTQYENAIETFVRISGARRAQYPDVDLSRVDYLFPDDITVAREYALAHHPALRALAAQEDAARENIVVARQSRMPAIDVRASAIQMDDLPIVDRLRDGRVGVYLSVPLYDRGASTANMERVRFTVAGIEERIRETRRVITENLNQAWNIYVAQGDAIDAARASVTAAKSALGGIRDEQQRGRRTVLDVLNAEQELLNAQVSLVRAQHSRTSAFFAVLAAMGMLSAENLGLVAMDSCDE